MAIDHSNLRSTRLSDGRLRLVTLVRLRWLAVSGQSLAVILVYFWLGFKLELGWCFALIALSAWLNIFLRLKFAAVRRLENRYAALLLAYDILQLAGLLFLTGGLDNPFAVLLLAPVMVSAAALPWKFMVMLGGLVMFVATVLTITHLPLPWKNGESIQLPFTYSLGVWIALVSTLGFMAIYAFSVAEEARQMADALAATELVLAREQHLSALDGLAAATAHELGTPLGTIAVVAKELERDLPGESPLADDARLLRTQSERCREILGRLRSLSSDDASQITRLRVSHLLEEVAVPYREFGVEVEIDLRSDGSSEPVCARNPAILFGLKNLLENAVDFAEDKVEFSAEWNEESVRVEIIDDGPGFSSDIIDQIGDPYVTTRNRRQPGDRTGGGLGLGYFIAKTLLERSGGRLNRANRKSPLKGAVVAIQWSRQAFERELTT